MQGVQINWVDSRSSDEWTDCADIELCHAYIRTLGYLVKENEDMVCIAGCVDDLSGQVSGLIFIPKMCILSRIEVP